MQHQMLKSECMKSIKKLIVMCAAGSLALLTAACGGRAADAEQQVPTVNVATLHAVSDAAKLQYPGRVKAAEEINLAFKVSGRIERILVKEGDYIKAGQLVAVIDPTDYETQLLATRAEHAQVTAESDRIIRLYADSAATANNYDRAVYGKQQIDAKLRNHENQLAYTKLYAPISGYIQSKLVGAGEVVSAGMPVLTLFSATNPEVEISLSAADYMRRTAFGECNCSFDIFPGHRFRLTPISIAPKANANQLFTMRLSLHGEGNLMPTPGMSTMVTIALKNDSKAAEFTMPTTGVLHTAEGGSVFVLDTESNTLRQCTVTVSRLLTDGNCVVFSDQLNDGDVVVVSGIHHVKAGQKVKPLAPPSETNVGGLL